MAVVHGQGYTQARACDGDSDSDWDALPPLFDEDELRVKEAPKALHAESGWSVIEAPHPGGGSLRWITQTVVCGSLDQTRVELRADGSFVRDHIRAHSNQAEALAAALAIAGRGGDMGCDDGPLVCVLGGGGMAMPMAMLAGCADVRLHVVELDPCCVELAARFFGASAGAAGGRLSVQVADALAVVAHGRLPRCDALVVDIDFRAIGVRLSALAFWAEALRALRLGGVVVVNTIGASSDDADALARVALSAAGVGIGAGAVEPDESMEKSWNAFHPRPSILLVGPDELIDLFGSPDVLAARLEAAGHAWATTAAAEILGLLRDGAGSAGRWRRIP